MFSPARERQHGEPESLDRNRARRQRPLLFHQCACSMPLQSPSSTCSRTWMSSRLCSVTWISQFIIRSFHIHVQCQSDQISIRRSFATARAKRFKAGSQRPSPLAPSGEAPCLPSSPRPKVHATAHPPLLFSLIHPSSPSAVSLPHALFCHIKSLLRLWDRPILLSSPPKAISCPYLRA